MVQKFNGIIADGNPLKVSIVEPPPVLSLKDRMRSKPGNGMEVDDEPAQVDLLPSGSARYVPALASPVAAPNASCRLSQQDVLG